MATFKAIRIDKADKGTTAALTQFDEADLMDGDVTVRVEWSTLNYKDGLAVTGKAPVVRRFPMIAGIDFAGTVEQSSHPQWKAGDKVICTGWGMGETHLGAYAEKARVKGDWLVRVAARTVGARRDGDRHRRLHRDARGAGAGEAGTDASERTGGGHGRGRRCRLGCDRGAVQARLSRDRLDRPHVGGRLSEEPRRRRGDRPQRASAAPPSRSPRSAGPAASTASARPRSPICCR